MKRQRDKEMQHQERETASKSK